MTDTELQTAYDEVLRKIGRNLIIFQKAEYCIKGLIAMGSFRLSPSDGPKTLADVIVGMRKETMGGLKSQLFEKHYYDVEEPKPPIKESTDPDELSVQTTFTRQLPDLDLRRAAIENMVAERNKLVHNLLPELEPCTLDSCAAAARMLDHQRETILPELEWLQDQFQETHEQIMEMLNFINSEEGKEMMRTGEIQQSHAIRKLASLAEATTNPDGWISVRDAYLQLDEDEQSEITRIQRYYNLTSLSSVIAASRMFEIKFERGEKRPGKYLFRLIQIASVST